MQKRVAGARSSDQSRKELLGFDPEPLSSSSISCRDLDAGPDLTEHLRPLVLTTAEVTGAGWTSARDL